MGHFYRRNWTFTLRNKSTARHSLGQRLLSLPTLSSRTAPADGPCAPLPAWPSALSPPSRGPAARGGARGGASRNSILGAEWGSPASRGCCWRTAWSSLRGGLWRRVVSPSLLGPLQTFPGIQVPPLQHAACSAPPAELSAPPTQRRCIYGGAEEQDCKVPTRAWWVRWVRWAWWV